MKKIPKSKMRSYGEVWLLDVTKETEKYFGGFVKKVEISVDDKVPRAEAEMSANILLDSIAAFKNDDELDIDNLDLYLTLPNDKMINICAFGEGSIREIKSEEDMNGRRSEEWEAMREWKDPSAFFDDPDFF